MMATSSILQNCKVCEEPAKGKHFGAVSCRACAAFFRRAASTDQLKPCRYKNQCNSFKKGCFTCKQCRLRKCYAVGMSSENFQFDRDAYSTTIETRIPETMDTFLGRSNLIIFTASEPSGTRNFIDLRFLLDQAIEVIKQGPPTPLNSYSNLKKLSLGFQQLQECRDPQKVEKFGQNEAIEQLQTQMLKVTKWLTYFNEFQKLPQSLQLKMLQGSWSVWNRLVGLANIALEIQQNIHEETLKRMKNDELIFKWEGKMEVDLSWCSKYALEQLKFFLPISNEIRLDTLTRSLIELQPSDVELSYMLGQLCFHYVGKRFQGEILCVADKFQEMLANDLHDYYTCEMKRPHYVSRVAEMMKINNMIQMEVNKHREKIDLAQVFNVFCVDVSHPDMFLL